MCKCGMYSGTSDKGHSEMKKCPLFGGIRASVDALCRDGTS